MVISSDLNIVQRLKTVLEKFLLFKTENSWGTSNDADQRRTQNSPGAVLYAASYREPIAGYARPSQQDQGSCRDVGSRADSFDVEDEVIARVFFVAARFFALCVLSLAGGMWIMYRNAKKRRK